MIIALYARANYPQNRPYLDLLFDFMDGRPEQIIVFEDLLPQIQLLKNAPKQKIEIFGSNHKLPAETKVLLSLGGDGTLLESIKIAAPAGIPVYGINTGRLGFLTGSNGESIKTDVQKIFDKHYLLEPRTLITVKCTSEKGRIYNLQNPFALNEIALSKTDTSAMVHITTNLNHEPLSSFYGDGLLISTPTGSTGYNISCGGPIVMPDTPALLLTPICPHNLTLRPLIIPDTSKIDIKITAREGHVLLSLDGRSTHVPTGTNFSISKEKFNAVLVRLPEDSFLKRLSAKLNWGVDLRN